MSQTNHYHKSRQSGFTLIELLIVMAIVGILSAISIFGLQGARESGRDSKRKADLEAIRSALEIYRADCGDYPPTGFTSNTSLAGDGTPASCAATNVYMPKIPKDPDGVTSYNYRRLANTRYELCATLEQVPTTPDSCVGGGNYKVLSP